MDYTDDIVLIRTSELEDNSAVQLLKVGFFQHAKVRMCSLSFRLPVKSNI